MTKPIWHSPAWITAIVGLVAAFLTVPEKVANYFQQQQDIERLKIENQSSKQDKEFEVARNTLAQQGRERVFLLRYLAATHDDVDTKAWAEAEVTRLDDIIRMQKEVEQTRAEAEDLTARLREGTQNREQLRKNLEELHVKLNNKNLEIAELKQQAGLSSEVENPRAFPPAYQSTTDARHCRSHLIYGSPSEDGHVICRLGFAFSYDTDRMIPIWASYRLLASPPVVVSSRRRLMFRPDPEVPVPQNYLSNFRGSGYDRGHLVPTIAVLWNWNAAQEAQFSSNITPQNPRFNRGIWARLDRVIRVWVEERGMLYVISGPVFNSDNVKWINQIVAIPDLFFKIVFDPVSRSSLAFLIPNTNVASSSRLEDFLVTVNEIEKKTGLDFFSELPDNEQSLLESTPATELWH